MPPSHDYLDVKIHGQGQHLRALTAPRPGQDPGGRPGRALGDDTPIQRDRPDPGHRLFGQATSRTRHNPTTTPNTPRKAPGGRPGGAPGDPPPNQRAPPSPGPPPFRKTPSPAPPHPQHQR